MTISGDMLRRLGSGVRPGDVGATTAVGKPPAESQGFDALFKAAQGAAFRSEPVKLGRGSKVELDAGQLRRLGGAVDAAEASGGSKLLAFIDGKGVIVDVASRTVEGLAKPGSGVVNGVDAVVVVEDEPELVASEPGSAGAGSKDGTAAAEKTVAIAGSGVLPLPSMESVRNRSLSELLASLKGAA